MYNIYYIALIIRKNAFYIKSNTWEIPSLPGRSPCRPTNSRNLPLQSGSSTSRKFREFHNFLTTLSQLAGDIRPARYGPSAVSEYSVSSSHSAIRRNRRSDFTNNWYIHLNNYFNYYLFTISNVVFDPSNISRVKRRKNTLTSFSVHDKVLLGDVSTSLFADDLSTHITATND